MVPRSPILALVVLAALVLAGGTAPAPAAAHAGHPHAALDALQDGVPAARLYLPLGLAFARPEERVRPRPAPPTRTSVVPTAAPSATEPAPTIAPTSTATTLPEATATALPTPSPTPEPTAVEPGADACPAELFLLDPQAHPANGAYPDPELAVDCTQEHLVVRSNGIPSFAFRQITPNDLQAQDYTWRIPRDARLADAPSDIPLLGPVAIMIDGLPIYGPNEAPTQGTADPYLDQILDACNGHTAQRGDYHYHARADCLLPAVEHPRDWVGRVVGYGFDGFPILAPWVCVDEGCREVRMLESSWRRTQDLRNAWEAHEYVAGSGDLDRCNGRRDESGAYHYYATDSFPYLLGCYAGTPEDNGGAGGQGGGGGQRPPRPRP